MIHIHLNNEIHKIEKNTTLFELLKQKSFLDTGCAVALNHHFISRIHYETTSLVENDIVDIIIPMQGG